jgi:hypothetical protein
MVQHCPRCRRANPREAVFCYHDGIALRQGGPAPGQLAREFVFPSGRRCRSFDDLVQGCQYEWEDARELLRRGDFARYLGTVGRADLVRAAQEAQAQPDPDIALHNFVENLPANQVQGPRLDLDPRRLTLKAVRVGEQRQVRLTVANQGKGLLQGKLTVSEGGLWLKVDGADGDGRCPIKAARDEQITLRIDTRGLTAPQTYSAKLTVITNGGIAEVPVRLDLTAVPFPKPPFQGAGSPRALAERMRTNPKQAVPMLESGEVARWFSLNGWTYPVAGTPARGVAAVQQFFECLGLSKPPPLQLSDEEVRFLCVPPEVVRGAVTVRTSARKWVYAQADSDVAWLRVTTPSVSGPQQAQVGFEVDSGLMDADQSHQGTVRLLANAGQKLAVRVRVEVRRPRKPAAGRLLQGLLVGAALALLLRALLVLPADLFARVLGAGAHPPPAGSLARWLETPGTEDGFLKLFVLATWWLGGILGVVLVWRRGGRWTDLICGAVAGAALGVIASATLGCALIVVDALPRFLLAKAVGPRPGTSPWVWTPVWALLAVACWTALGGALGLLLSVAGPGRLLLGAAAAPLAGVFRACGLDRAADFFALHG